MRKVQALCRPVIFLWSFFCAFFPVAAGVFLVPLLHSVLAKSVNTGNMVLFMGALVLVGALFLLLLAVFFRQLRILCGMEEEDTRIGSLVKTLFFVSAFFVLFVGAFSVLQGLIAVLLQSMLGYDTAKSVVDIVAAASSILLLPLLINALFVAGTREELLRQVFARSFAFLKSRYWKILLALLLGSAFGVLLSFLAGLAGVVGSKAILLVGGTAAGMMMLVFISSLYLDDSASSKTPKEKGKSKEVYAKRKIG